MSAKKTRSTLGPLGFILIAAALWGASGTAAQVLFQYYYFPPSIIVSIRMILSGAVLFVLVRPKWPMGDIGKFAMFSLLGILPSQLFYFLAINYSNVVTATLLQCLFLPMIAGYEIYAGRFRMSRPLGVALFLAAVGAAALVVGGPMGIKLEVTPAGIACGLLSAVAVAYYTLSSRDLIKKYGSWPVITWGFVLGGLLMIPYGALTFVTTPLLLTRLVAPGADALILFVTFFGTLLAYGLYLRGLGRLDGTESALAATAEPLAAAAISYTVLHLILTSYQYVGGALILIAVVIIKASAGLPKKTAIKDTVVFE